MAQRRRRRTPVRDAFNPTSTLLKKVRDGIEALSKPHRKCLAEDVRGAFADSIDLDAALQDAHPQQSRWDYLLGYQLKVVGLEPHSAKQDQISIVIKKKKAAVRQLSGHLKAGKRVSNWLWVASKNVEFADTEKARRRLDENGIQFVGRQVLARHLSSTVVIL